MTATDARTPATAIGVMVLVSALAVVPAGPRRASRADPMVALRYD